SAELLLREPFTPAAAERVLVALGEATGVSRTYLFRHRLDAAGDCLADQIAEWAAAGIEPQRDNPEMQGFSYRATGNEWILARLAAGETIAARAAELPAAFQPILEKQAIRSLVLTPIRRHGELWGFVGFDECRSDRRWSEAETGALRVAASLLGAAVERGDAERERQRGEERARQGERMEALGWLAAGLARDFDALMTTIRGYGERVLAELRPGDRMRADVSEMLLAAERAAEMTRDLASLGRRQPARPQRFEVAGWLAERLPLLRRLVGEEFVLTVAATAPVGEIEADPELLEQALVTFVLDARERLAAGGCIELACDRLADEALQGRDLGEAFAGGALRVAIRDDGQPLPAEATQRLFEPFAAGEQTPAARGALGRAAAYGIVRQCGGVVWLAASGDTGTVCELLLPAVRAEPAAAGSPRAARSPGAGAATVLLVEDEDLIRNLAEQILLEAGYRVLSAANASEAIEIAGRSDEQIDLLLTDVVMPGVSGTDLAHRLLRHHPEMRILYMSGYSDSLIFRYGVLEERAAFLRKPFSAEALERRIAELLAGAG
ncbi:MAG: response regulator, partial [Thermoanaerobaculia bacterium]|nr:response regulator [Thermoanaerobaculia bacterium]